VALLLLAALALAPGADRTRTAHHPSRTASSGARAAHSLKGHAEAVSRRQLVRARSAARRFLAGYLRVAYGEASASSVREAAPALLRRLRGRRVLVAPVARLRHPRVISLVATAQAHGVALATALVDDGGIANYSVRVTLRETRSRWVVSAVDGG
jgi:hypothetical protein